MQYQFGLTSQEPTARGQLILIKEYWGKTLAAAGTICPEVLSFKIPYSGLAALSAWQLRKGTDKLLLVDRLRFCLQGFINDKPSPA